MSTDELFRNIMLAGCAVVIPVAAYFRISSQSTREKLDRLQEGLFILIGLRLFALAGAAGVIAYLMDPENMRWSYIELPIIYRWTGVVIGILGAALWMVTFRYLGKNLTDTVVTRKEHTLVKNGPYRLIRHPFYAAMAAMALGNSLTMANWFVFIAGIGVLTFIYLRTPKEEAKLIERFGADYRQYMAETGRFFPKFR